MRNTLLLISLFAAAMNPIDRWANAVGGREKLAAVHSMYREATLEVGGLTGTVKSWSTADGKYRDEVQIATFSTVQTFDGANGVVQQGNSPAHKMAGADLERAVSQAYAESNAMFFPDRRRGSTTAEGDNVIVVKPEGGTEARVTLDPETSLPKSVTLHEGDRTVTTTFVSYETVDGVKLAKEIRQSSGDPRSDAVIRFTKTEINPPISASLFSL